MQMVIFCFRKSQKQMWGQQRALGEHQSVLWEFQTGCPVAVVSDSSFILRIINSPQAASFGSATLV